MDVFLDGPISGRLVNGDGRFMVMLRYGRPVISHTGDGVLNEMVTLNQATPIASGA